MEIQKFAEYICSSRIKKLLKENEINQRELCNQTGLSSAVISSAVTGKHILSETNAKKISAKYNVSYEWLMGGLCDMYGNSIDDAGLIADLFCEADILIREQIKKLLLFPQAEANHNNTFIDGLQQQLDNIQAQLDQLK